MGFLFVCFFVFYLAFDLCLTSEPNCMWYEVCVIVKCYIILGKAYGLTQDVISM